MPVKLKQEAKDQLASQFLQWIEEVEDDRRDRMHEIYVNALRNYEGKEPVKNLPWPGASNAVLPITGTHADAIASRLYNAATAHDPIFLIRSHGTKEAIPGIPVSTEDFARWWQNISKWIEQTQVDYKDLMEENILTFVLYGDAFVYTVWTRREVLFPSGVDDELVPQVLSDKPELSVIHPKDVLLRSYEKGPQDAETVGFLYDVSLLEIERNRETGKWDKEACNKILSLYRKTELDRASIKEKIKQNHYNPIGGEYMSPDEYEEKMKELLGIQTSENKNLVKMVRTYWRIDLENRGKPAEYVIDMDKENGIPVSIDYNRDRHRERALTHYRYSRRAGTWMSRGVPELLFNIQKIMNVTMRDILDNNKIQNTQVYLLKKGGSIKKQTRIFPGKHLWVDNPAGPNADFVPAAMGTGRSNTSVQDISIMERWGQLITGITDFNLGQEKRSRTPAATTLALIEQGNQRLERPIDTMRRAMGDTHWQVLQLFLQHYNDLDTLAEVAGADPILFKQVWINTTPEIFRKLVKISPEVSSNAFNRQSQRQEALALSGYVEQLYQKVALLAQQIGAAASGQPPGPMDPNTGQPSTPAVPPNPTMVALLSLMAKGLHRMAKRVLDTFDVKEQEDLNPETVIQLAASMQSEPNSTGQDANNPNGPSQTAGRVVAQGNNQAQPAEAPGRPQSGQPRSPAATPGQPG